MNRWRKAGCVVVLFLASLTAFGQCVQVGPNYYSCGVPSAEFDYMRANSVNGGLQIQSNWCWAACVQMVLNYHSLRVTQLDVVTRIYGSPYVDQPAGEAQILAALSGWAPNTQGGYSRINAYGGYTSLNEIISGLGNKDPLIVGMRNPNGGTGHAYVLTGIYFSNQYDYAGNIIGRVPVKVVLRDPWPGNESRQEWEWNRFAAYCFMGVKVWTS